MCVWRGHTLESVLEKATLTALEYVGTAQSFKKSAAGNVDTRYKSGKFAVFEDAGSQGLDAALPSARALDVFYRDVFQRGQMELECIVTSLIYVERLLKVLKP